MEHIKSEDMGRTEFDIAFVVELLERAEKRSQFSELSIFFDNGKIYAVDELRGSSPIPRRVVE
jgi:hypothetical protein